MANSPRRLSKLNGRGGDAGADGASVLSRASRHSRSASSSAGRASLNNGGGMMGGLGAHHPAFGSSQSAHNLGATSGQTRGQSLIKKNIAPADVRPSDVLVERFTAWKLIVKQLVSYFGGIAEIERTVAREYTRLSAVIQVPFRTGNQFLGEGGLQDVFFGIRDRSRTIADQHANFGKTIDSSIVQHLQKLHTEIKAHIKNIQDDTGKLTMSVDKERAMSTKLIAELARNVAMFKNTPMGITPRDDPYVANLAVSRQLLKQVHEENALQKSIIIMQQNSAHFEEGIVRAVQSAWQTYDEWQSRMNNSIQNVWRELAAHMASLAPDREWLAFSARSDHLIDPDTPLRNPETINYPSKEDPSVIPLHSGFLERKRRFMRTYREAYYVLTSAGYLHEFNMSDLNDPRAVPIFSLFLPACTLGPPSAPTVKSHKFHIEGRKDGTGAAGKSGSTGFGSLSLKRRGPHAYTFRSRSHEDMMEWWNDVRMLCARYLVASEQIERSGPVEAAVRAAGYLSEEDEEDEEGSSVEEEEETDNDMYFMAEDGTEQGDDDQVPPSYSQQHNGGIKTLNFGANGYLNEKKDTHARFAGTPNGNTSGGANVQRRMSKRQQEKAPEGQPRSSLASDGVNGSPRAGEGTSKPMNDVNGHAANGHATGPGESRFTEVVDE